MAKKHFFKPLLPGFHSHLTIPVAFFSKYIEGRNEHAAKLRSDASNVTWKVKIEDGRKLTDGWEEFALAHDLRIGDIVIFKQEKDMAFHVTLFGPSCCEIQYDLCLDYENNIGKIPKKKNPKRAAEPSSSLDPSCFLANVLPSTIHYDALNLPRSFARANGLETRWGDIVLMNEKGKSWTLALKQKKVGRTYIRRGWRRFCSANGLKVGDSFTFKLIKRGATLVLRMSPFHTESEEEECSEESNQEEKSKKRKSLWKASSSPSRNRFVTLTLSPYSVKKYVMFLPLPFTDLHGITVGTKMSLLDKNGVKWSIKLRSEGKRLRLGRGWKDFFKANCVRIGESIMLKLIWEEDLISCVLKFWSKVKP